MTPRTRSPDPSPLGPPAGPPSSAPKASSENFPSLANIATQLSRSDPILAALIHRQGLPGIPRGPRGFPALAQSIIYQQIHGRAGDAIVRRIRARAGGRFPPPTWFAEASSTLLGEVGLSPQKKAYLKDLSSRILRGDLSLRTLCRRSDEEVIRALDEVHGIGRWTAQMYLIFSLRRPDVLPTGDLGIRKALMKAYRLPKLPSETTVARRGEPWRPFRSYATCLLWESLEEPTDVAGPRPLERVPAPSRRDIEIRLPRKRR